MNSQSRSTDVWRKQHEIQHEALNESLFLYWDWIYPNTKEIWRDRDVLDAGSGPGTQIRMMAEVAKSVTAVDLEAIDVSRSTTQDIKGKITYIQDDIGTMQLQQEFDVINCVGTIHHTDDPTVTFDNLFAHLRPGGRMIIWAYAYEGNALMRRVVEPARQRFLMGASHSRIQAISTALTAGMYPVVHTAYRLPLRSLPYYEYFGNFRRMSFRRNMLNVYDKLNAPQQHFLSRRQMEAWFNPERFTDVHISQYAGVSWRASGTKVS